LPGLHWSGWSATVGSYRSASQPISKPGGRADFARPTSLESSTITIPFGTPIPYRRPPGPAWYRRCCRSECFPLRDLAQKSRIGVEKGQKESTGVLAPSLISAASPAHRAKRHWSADNLAPPFTTTYNRPCAASPATSGTPRRVWPSFTLGGKLVFVERMDGKQVADSTASATATSSDSLTGDRSAID